MTTNQNVVTPIGKGIVQGAFAVQDALGGLVVNGVIVRVPVNDETRSHLVRSNCLTPMAKHSALYVFEIKELK